MPLYGTLLICLTIVASTVFIFYRRSTGQNKKRASSVSNTPPPQQQPRTTLPPQQAKSGGSSKNLPVKWLVATPVVICLAFLGYYFWTRGDKEIKQTATGKLLENAPEEVILEEIAKCESGGKQFTDNVVTRNMNGTPGDPSDDDIGELQINLKHQAKLIEELKADVYTREGNYLVGTEILRRQGTDPWNATRSCWEKGLVARGYNPNKGYLPSSRKEEVASKDGEWSPVVNNDRRFEKVRWYPNQKEGCEIRADEDDQKVFGCGEVLNLDVVPKTFSFRHKKKEPMTVEVRFTDPFNR